MIVLKPSWITHNGMPIFSIDIHPDGTRLATGGQGSDSGLVILWNTAAILDENSENDENVPKILCHVDSHLACVNCVRWSTSGKYLASGGDDKIIMIWSLTKYPNSGNVVFGTKNIVNIETWKCMYTLRSHSGDILDLAWSPQDTYLASCSVDNTIIIWDAQKFPSVHKILTGHTGLVKGVSWDPIGKYISSQSDDKSLRIWRTSDWQSDTIITTPFKDCGGNTAVLRHSWSPDGQYLISAHAMNNTGPVAKVIERDGWTYEKDYVGHRKAINCVRFSSSIMERKIGKKTHKMCLSAVGSRDSNVSVWLTGLRRPVVVLESLFQGPVLDLSWSKDGLNLYACSFDGTIAILLFDQKDIGKALTDQEKNAIYEKMYGVSLLERQNNTMLIENPAILKMNGIQSVVKTIDYSSKKEIKIPPKTLPPILKKQIETRTSDGRRRITPIFIPPTSDNTEEINILPFSSSSESKSQVVIERVDDIIEPNISNSCSNFSQESQTPKIIDSTVLKNPPTSVLQVSPHRNESKKKSEPQSMLSSLFPIKKIKFNAVEEKCDNLKSDFIQCSAQKRKYTVSDEGAYKVVIENEKCNTTSGPISKMKVYSNNIIIWEKVFSSSIVKYCMNKTLCVLIVALSNSTIHLLESKNGSPVCPPYVLSSPVNQISSNNNYLLCMTQNTLSVWDINEQVCVLHEEKLNTLICSNKNKPVHVQKCMLTENGTALITLTTGKSYMFSIKTKCWMMIGDSGDPIYSYSSQKHKHNELNKSSTQYPLSVMQAYSSKYKPNLILKGNEEITSLCSKAFLEQQMSAALALESDKEYKYWLLTFVSFLTETEDNESLRFLCQSLLGSSHSYQKHKKNHTILGMSKHELLKEVLVIVAGSRSTQRIFTEFHDQLQQLSR
ncbi:protein HIRA homolog [Daktulosphaira vitifoliae]|uniref:protein HIRA homolog n=1 Tax=Daktulosphaira vitifoliae TaxID=58002 RepID=UPI0021AA60E2|nr:protein HIRA homolog [Daktulosphaira vitifoliae]